MRSAEFPAAPVDQITVLNEITGMIEQLFTEYSLDPTEITMDTGIHEDLELESVDLVTLGGRITERYGDRINLAEYLAELDLEQIIRLTVGDLVRYVVACHGGDETSSSSGDGDGDGDGDRDGNGGAR